MRALRKQKLLRNLYRAQQYIKSKDKSAAFGVGSNEKDANALRAMPQKIIDGTLDNEVNTREIRQFSPVSMTSNKLILDKKDDTPI